MAERLEATALDMANMQAVIAGALQEELRCNMIGATVPEWAQEILITWNRCEWIPWRGRFWHREGDSWVSTRTME